MKSVAVLVANGSEEMETVIVVDILRRAGLRVDLTALTAGPIACSRGVCLESDRVLNNADLDDYDALVLPGGMEGMKCMRSDPRVIDAVRNANANSKLIGAICAAPLVLQEAGILNGRRTACHPGVASMLTEAEHIDQRVVVDENLVTSQGPGTAIPFALKIVELLLDSNAGEQVAEGLVI